MTEPSNQWERKRARTRELILITAEEMLRTAAWDNISVEAIADESGLVRTTIFNHFKTKSEILEAVGLLIIAEVESAVSEIRPPRVKILVDRIGLTRAAIQKIDVVLATNPNVATMLWLSVRDQPSSADALHPSYVALRKIVEDAISLSYVPHARNAKGLQAWVSYDELSSFVTYFVLQHAGTGVPYPRAFWELYETYAAASDRSGIGIPLPRSVTQDLGPDPT